MNMRFNYGVMLAFLFSISISANLFCKARGFKIQVTSTYVSNNDERRTLELYINDILAGHINYKISRQAHKPSFISHLHVERPFRGLSGCGKMLLYSALNDILLDGSKEIELERQPFDLPAGESYQQRDIQLKKWYSEFGFVEKAGHPGHMHLVDTGKFHSNEVVSSFTPDGVLFLFRSK